MFNENVEMKEMLLKNYLLEQELKMYLEINNVPPKKKWMIILNRNKTSLAIGIIIIIISYMLVSNGTTSQIQSLVNKAYILSFFMISAILIAVTHYFINPVRVNKKIEELKKKIN